MSNILFIICPFSPVENMLKKKYGPDILFISCPGAIIPYNDHAFIEVLKGEVIRNKIKTVYFVNETSSRILNSVLLAKEPFGLEAEQLVQNIYNTIFSSSLKGRSIQYQQLRLAELVVQNQQNDFLTNGIFTDLIIDQKITIKTLVISRAINIIKESRIKAPVNKIYEL